MNRNTSASIVRQWDDLSSSNDNQPDCMGADGKAEEAEFRRSAVGFGLFSLWLLGGTWLGYVALKAALV